MRTVTNGVINGVESGLEFDGITPSGETYRCTVWEEVRRAGWLNLSATALHVGGADDDHLSPPELEANELNLPRELEVGRDVPKDTVVEVARRLAGIQFFLIVGAEILEVPEVQPGS